MIAATLEKYHERIHIPPESDLLADMHTRQDNLATKLVLPRSDDPSEWSQVLAYLIKHVGTDRIDTYSRTLQYAKDIASASAKAISAGTSGGINERRCMTYLFARLAEYRKKWPESYAYDADLSFSEWRARLLVHVNKIVPRGRRSKNIRHITAVGTMALAWVWAINNQIGWTATPAKVDVDTLKQIRGAYGIPKVEPEVCKLCFRLAAYVVSAPTGNGYHSTLFDLYCAHHVIDNGLFEPIEQTSVLDHRVKVANLASAARRASNAALVAEDQKALDNVASAIETLFAVLLQLNH